MNTAQVESNDVAKALIEGSLAAFRSNKGWADRVRSQKAVTRKRSEVKVLAHERGSVPVYAKRLPRRIIREEHRHS
jgi:hypothetical protein